jgi:hypothetical protein
MWTLFKRECEDIRTYLTIFIVIGAAPIVFTELMRWDWLKVTPFAYVVLCLLLLAVGSTRMVTDRNNGISTFFAGHLTTRGHLFAVRIVMGIFYVLLFCIPIVCWFFWKFSQNVKETQDYAAAEMMQGTFWAFSITGWVQVILFLLLLPWSCYNLGLRMGQVGNKIIPVFGSLCLGVLLLSFAVLKGFGFEALLLLVILNLSLIYSAWQSYAAAAL